MGGTVESLATAGAILRTSASGSLTADAIRRRTYGDVLYLVFPGTQSALETGAGGNSNILTGPIDVGVGKNVYIRLISLSGGNIGIFAGPTSSLSSAVQNSYSGVSGLPQTYTFTASYRYVWVYSYGYVANKTGSGYVSLVPGDAPKSVTVDAHMDKFGITTTRTIDAYLEGPRRTTHDRGTPPHYDTTPDTVIVLAKSLGVYQQGTDLHSVLTALVERVSDLEAGL